MKIIPLAVFLLLANIKLAFCPNLPTLAIMESKPVYGIEAIYSDLVDAIYTHESRCNTLAYNKAEEAYGGLQIRPCRLDHYNRLTGKNYTLNDMYDFNKAKEVFLYFCHHDSRGNLIKPKSFEQAAKNWNGSGPMTETYWSKIKGLLYS